jgi:hypothetical protein
VLQSQRRYRNFVMLNLTKLLLAWRFRALSAVTRNGVAGVICNHRRTATALARQAAAGSEFTRSPGVVQNRRRRRPVSAGRRGPMPAPRNRRATSTTPGGDLACAGPVLAVQQEKLPPLSAPPCPMHPAIGRAPQDAASCFCLPAGRPEYR